MKKRRFQPQKTESGEIGWILGLWWILLLSLLLCAGIQIECLQASKQYVEDALAASNLAAAVIDVEEYGKTHTFVIANDVTTLERYKKALMGNLALDENMTSSKTGMLAGPVRLERFAVYNVKDDAVEVTMMDQSGNKWTLVENLGTAVAPNGVKIQKTGVYSEVSYSVPSFFGLLFPARDGKLCDVAGNDEEGESISK